MGRNAVDPVRRLTLALLLASVAALGASVDDAPIDDVPVDDEPIAAAARRAPGEVAWRIGTAMAYDQRRCTERMLTGPPVSLVELVRRP
jgi:hypothetical protein